MLNNEEPSQTNRHRIRSAYKPSRRLRGAPTLIPATPTMFPDVGQKKRIRNAYLAGWRSENRREWEDGTTRFKPKTKMNERRCLFCGVTSGPGVLGFAKKRNMLDEIAIFFVARCVHVCDNGVLGIQLALKRGEERMRNRWTART